MSACYRHLSGRFARERLDGLEDLPRSGTPPIYSEATDKRIRAVLRLATTPKALPVGTDR